MGIGCYHEKSESDIEEILSNRKHYYEASLLQSSQKNLSVIFQAKDDDNQELQPSSLLEELVAQFQNPGQGFRDACKELFDADTLVWDSDAVCAALHLDESQQVTEEPIALSTRGCPLSSIDVPETLAPTSIEAYAKCPYKWFLVHGIGGSELDRDVGARDHGIIIHRILKAIFERWSEKHDVAITDENLQSARQLASEVVLELEKEDEYFQKLRQDYPGAYIRALQGVENILVTEPIRNRRLGNRVKPYLFEYRIKKEHGAHIQGIPIVGTVDRIDVSDSEYIVIDYKGNVGSNESRAVDERDIQAAIYLNALSLSVQNSDDEKALMLEYREPSGAIYRSYKKDNDADKYIIDKSIFPMHVKNKPKKEAYAAFVKLIDAVTAVSDDAVKGILASDIGPPSGGPRNEDICRYCSYLRCPGRLEDENDE
jgi:ATP-dependent helicase/DNAse subunit B